jgi:hypothetical protein
MKLINVYQNRCINTPGSYWGLGDYLRGCCFLWQIAKIHNFEFEMYLHNHKMCNFIVPLNNNAYIDKNSIIIYYNNEDESQFEKKLNEGTDFYLFTNKYPRLTVDDECKKFIIKNLQPKEEFLKYIEDFYKNRGIEKHKYKVLHIRIGDDYLVNSNLLSETNPLVGQITQIINENLTEYENYMIIADNDQLKKILVDKYKFIFKKTQIVHLGQKTEADLDQIRDTLFDFYMMSNATEIVQLSVYSWGSGFSEWCAKIYDLPLRQYKI